VPPTDYVERLNEGIVAALDTREGIADLTRQADGNVVLWRDNLAASLHDARDGLLAYHVVSALRGGGSIGDFRRFRVSVTAMARSEAVVNALCEQVELGLTSVSLAALSDPLDVRIEDVSRQPNPPDVDTGVHLATVDLILVLKR
jgi:hypothetical protein